MSKVPQQRIKRAISFYLTKLMPVRIDVTGDDLINMGIAKGPEIGLILKAVRDARLDGLIKNREEELKFIKDMLKKR
jgi:tRNA nucleotidyltransferase (CCA-adding enzyme)